MKRGKLLSVIILGVIMANGCEAPKKHRFRTVSCPAFGGPSSSERRTSMKEVTVMKVRGSRSDARIADGVSVKDEKSPGVTFFPSAGTLTAGEIHDFSKWKLWGDITDNKLKEWQEYWKTKPINRYTVQVTNEGGNPVVDCEVQLEDAEGITVWASRTDNTGKAELWANLFNPVEKQAGLYSIKAIYNGKSFIKERVSGFYNGINVIRISTSCSIPSETDAVFVVDATGSMGDEIRYLQSELNDVIGNVKAKHKDLKLRLGSVFYRDTGDEYVTRKSDLSSTINTTIEFIKNQSAGGGGDTPEAVEEALEAAINGMEWSKTARARLLFLVLDAPPHYNESTLLKCQKLVAKASAKGIRIIPVTGSGIDKATEYLMRCMALATNGTYVFLTDHSGVGGDHIEPTTDSYEVELLNKLLIRLFDQYTKTTECKMPVLSAADSAAKDTVVVSLVDSLPAPQIDSVFLSPTTRNNNLTASQDSNALPIIRPLVETKSGNTTSPEGKKISMRVYPNPTRGELNIELSGGIREIFLADMNGKLMQRMETKGKERIEMFIGDYSSGIYFIQYLHNDKWQSGKVVLVH